MPFPPFSAFSCLLAFSREIDFYAFQLLSQVSHRAVWQCFSTMSSTEFNSVGGLVSNTDEATYRAVSLFSEGQLRKYRQYQLCQIVSMGHLTNRLLHSHPGLYLIDSLKKERSLFLSQKKTVFLPETLSTPQPPFLDYGYTWTGCLLLHRLLIERRSDEVLQRRQELSKANLQHTCTTTRISKVR